VIIVMMDDFGHGQFAPNASAITAKDYDPAFVEFMARHGGDRPEVGLEYARRAMPALSALASDGVVFTNAFSSSNLCAPARVGVLTGVQQNRFGFYQNEDVERAGLPKGSALVARLRQGGYATALVGKYHAGMRDESLRLGVLKRFGLAPGALVKMDAAQRAEVDAEIRKTGYLGSAVPEHNPLNYGFDYYFGYNRWECPFYDSEHIWENWAYAGLQREYNTDLFTAKALDFIGRSKKQGKPFFLELCYHAVHGPLKPQAPAKYFDQFKGATYNMANFYAHVNGVDAGVAALKAELERAGDWDNTLLMFCSDNGGSIHAASPLPGNAPFRGHKGSMLQGGLHVPLLAHWPAGLKRHGWRAELASMLDLMPTALDAAGIAAPAGLDGKSLLPMLTGKTSRTHDYLLWAGMHARAWGFMAETTIGPAEPRRDESPGGWAVTDGNFMLRFVGTTPAGLFIDMPDGAPARRELYDMREDPGERTDLIDKLPQVAERLEKAYAAEAMKFVAPARWRRDRWRELMPAGHPEAR